MMTVPTTAAGSTTLIRWFDQIGRQDVPIVGGKGANLGEMTASGLPVPPGFVVTIAAYQRFYEASGIAPQVIAQLAGLDTDDPDALQQASKALRDIVVSADIPGDVRDAVTAAYRQLSGAPTDEALVAVRSSTTAEDTAQFSFAGMFESFRNVRGATALLERVKQCWASSFGAQVLFYRLKQGMPAEMPVAVVVQKMVNSTKSGVMFTVDPATNDRTKLVIEAAWGLGEVIVGGQVTPDRYVLAKDSLAVVEQTIGRKEFMLERDPCAGGTVRLDLAADERASRQVLDEQEVRAIGELGKRLEAHYGIPQDVDFAVKDGHIFLTQTRPITTLLRHGAARGAGTLGATGDSERPLLRGLGASPGVASGTVRVLATPAEEGRLRQGEILVARMTSPDWVPIMRRAAAIVTDAGGMTSHASIVSRELGIPCIVGTRDATRVLYDGMLVTVNAREGVVRAGAAAAVAPEAAAARRLAAGTPTPAVTATRLYVNNLNLAEPELAEAVARRDVDGVGLLRAEFMMLSALAKTHPRLLLQQGRGEEFVARMSERLLVFARAFHPRPVIYRAMDFRSNEFRGLAGGEQFEPREDNPMIGYRGCYRYTREPDLFALELRAIQQVRTEFQNLHLMIPFVRTGWEFRECKRLVDQSGLGGDRRLELWVMAEVPSVVSWLEEYVRLGVTGVSIGSNDLTQLVLGVDRDSEILAPLYDERDRAVLDAIRSIIRESHRLGITCSICGQAPSVYPEYVELLVRWGIDSISVNPDAIEQTRRNIAAAEQRLITDAARSRLSRRRRTR